MALKTFVQRSDVIAAAAGVVLLVGVALIAVGKVVPVGVVLVAAAFALFIRLGFMMVAEDREAKAAQVATPTPTRSPAAGTPAGWYPHPTMVGTQRYWDGKGWTGNVAPMGAPRRSAAAVSAATRKIAWGVGLMFLLPVLFLTFLNEPSYGGEACGTWISPTFTELEISLRRIRALEGSGALGVAQVEVIADRCNEKLSSQRTICLVLIGLGLGAGIAIPPIVRAARE